MLTELYVDGIEVDRVQDPVRFSSASRATGGCIGHTTHVDMYASGNWHCGAPLLARALGELPDPVDERRKVRRPTALDIEIDAVKDAAPNGRVSLVPPRNMSQIVSPNADACSSDEKLAAPIEPPSDRVDDLALALARLYVGREEAAVRERGAGEDGVVDGVADVGEVERGHASGTEEDVHERKRNRVD